MPELTISHKGLELRGPAAGKLSDVPTQAFPFTMGGDVLESILACANNGGELQLELGQSPALHFGDSSHKITPPPKDYQYDLYITKPYEFTRSAQKIPETMSVLFKNMQEQRARERAATMSRQQKAVVAKSHSNIVPPQPKGRKPVDSDIKTLQTALAAAEAGKSQ
jgi:RNA polymerase II elongation factor ELL